MKGMIKGNGRIMKNMNRTRWILNRMNIRTGRIIKRMNR